MRPQNTSSLNQLSKIASRVHTLYRPCGGTLYLWYIRCTARHGGVNLSRPVNFLVITSHIAQTLEPYPECILLEGPPVWQTFYFVSFRKNGRILRVNSIVLFSEIKWHLSTILLLLFPCMVKNQYSPHAYVSQIYAEHITSLSLFSGENTNQIIGAVQKLRNTLGGEGGV